MPQLATRAVYVPLGAVRLFRLLAFGATIGGRHGRCRDRTPQRHLMYLFSAGVVLLQMSGSPRDDPNVTAGTFPYSIRGVIRRAVRPASRRRPADDVGAGGTSLDRLDRSARHYPHNLKIRKMCQGSPNFTRCLTMCWHGYAGRPSQGAQCPISLILPSFPCVWVHGRFACR